MLIAAIILITAALASYSIGVWSEHRHGVLKWQHVGFFALGLLCDASGTYLMSLISASSGVQRPGIGAGLNAIMAITGVVALLLMVIHLVWAIAVLLRNLDVEKKRFHRFSILVWASWLVPYVTGAIGASLR